MVQLPRWWPILLAALVLPAHASDDDETLRRGLGDAAQRVREGAMARIVDAGPQGVRLARALSIDPDPRLRRMAWRILGEAGGPPDAQAARVLLAGAGSEPEGAEASSLVAHAAADALLAIAARLPPGEVLVGPHELSPLGSLALRNALRRELAGTMPGLPASGVLRVGGVCLPELERIAATRSYGPALRTQAVAILERCGGPDLFPTLGRLVSGTSRFDIEPHVMFDALAGAGKGPAPDAAYEYVIQCSNRRPGRDQRAALRFVAVCPPQARNEALEERLHDLIGRGRRSHPVIATEVVCALLALGEPTDDLLSDVARTVCDRTWGRSRTEELVRAMMALSAYADRASVQEAAVAIWRDVEDDPPPVAIDLWGRYLLDPEDQHLAEDVLATWGEGPREPILTRRYLVRLLERLGCTHGEAIRRLLDDDDDWVRARLLEWTDQLDANDAGRLLDGETRSESTDLFLAALGRQVVPELGPPELADVTEDGLERALVLLVEGHRKERIGAAAALERLLDRRIEGIDADAPLDRRLEAARAVRALPR